jgi:type 1 fimbriae regulatory protein FimB/type 1 fimbriae regulatory protein FimE
MAAKLSVVGGSAAKVLIPVRGGRRSNKELGRTRKHLTPEEVERLDMAARHGLRVSEIVGLKRSAIDLDKGRMQVHRLKGGLPSVHPLDGATLRALRKLYRDTGDHVYVFVSERKGPMAREAFQRMVERAGEIAGLRFAVHPHMLRHACGYRLANEGKDAFAIQGWLGHQSLGMTKEYCALAADRFKDW